MWVNSYEPAKTDWYIVLIDTIKIPMMWNSHNKFWCDLSGTTYKMSDILCWLDDSKLTIPEYCFVKYT